MRGLIDLIGPIVRAQGRVMIRLRHPSLSVFVSLRPCSVFRLPYSVFVLPSLRTYVFQFHTWTPPQLLMEHVVLRVPIPHKEYS